MKHKPLKICRLWETEDRKEYVEDQDAEWLVADLRRVVENEPTFKFPLALIPVDKHKFNLDRGLFSFARHMKHVMDADLSFPIIVSEYGSVLDGRHRIVKALIEGHATVLAKRVPLGTPPSRYKNI